MNEQAIRDWIAAVPRADGRSLHAWAKAAGVPHVVLYRFRSGEHKAIAPHNLARLAAVCSLPLPGAGP